MIETYGHLKGIQMNERDIKPELPIHVILGASDYVKIKMPKFPRVGKINEPIAEQTKVGWIIMSSGRESNLVSSLYTRTPASDFDHLCDIDLLGVKENHLIHDENFRPNRILGILLTVFWKKSHPLKANCKTSIITNDTQMNQI